MQIDLSDAKVWIPIFAAALSALAAWVALWLSWQNHRRTAKQSSVSLKTFFNETCHKHERSNGTVEESYVYTLRIINEGRPVVLEKVGLGLSRSDYMPCISPGVPSDGRLLKPYDHCEFHFGQQFVDHFAEATKATHIFIRTKCGNVIRRRHRKELKQFLARLPKMRTKH